MIGAVALVVIGPEKLPKVARTAGMLFGRAQRLAAGFRADLERELHTAEIADLKKKLTDEATSFKDEMAESAASLSLALSEPENRILPEAPAPESAPLLPQDAGETAQPKPARRRRKPAASTAETALTPTTEEAQSQTAPSPKTPRKRKPAAPQVDLFAEAPAESAPTDWGDRR